MIDAREARIVYEENEYKNQIRDLLQAQKEAEEAIIRKQKELEKEAKCETILQPLYDKIAEASADGYNEVMLYLSDFCYRKISYSADCTYWLNIDVRPIPCVICGYGNMPEQRHTVSHIIKTILESHGYEVEITREYWGYNEYDALMIKW